MTTDCGRHRAAAYEYQRDRGILKSAHAALLRTYVLEALEDHPFLDLLVGCEAVLLHLEHAEVIINLHPERTGLRERNLPPKTHAAATMNDHSESRSRRRGSQNAQGGLTVRKTASSHLSSG